MTEPAVINLTSKARIGDPFARRLPRVVKRLPRTVSFIVIGLVISGVALIALGRNLAATFLLGWLILGCIFYARRHFESALYLFAFALPFEQIFFFWAGSRFNTLSYLVMALALIGLWRFGQRAVWRRLTDTEALAALWLFWGFLTLFWATDLENGFAQSITNAGGVTLLYIYSRGLQSEDDVLCCLQHFIAGTLIVNGLLFTYYDPSSTFVYREDGQLIQSALALGTGVAPAEFARAGVVSMVGSLILWELEKKWQKKRIALILTLFFGMTVILTLIRTVTFAGAIALFVWALNRKGSQKLGKIVWVVILLSTIAVGAWITNPGAVGFRFGTTLENYESGDLRRITAGRSEIWAVAWELFQEHPLQGIGLGSFPLQYSLRVIDVPRGDHSAYVQMFAETGLIGGLIFIALLVKLGWNAYTLRQWRSLTLPLWAAFVLIFVSQGLGRAKEFWIVSALMLFLVRHSKQLQRKRTLNALPVAATRTSIV